MVQPSDNYDPEAAADAISRVLSGSTGDPASDPSRYGTAGFTPVSGGVAPVQGPLTSAEKAPAVLQGGINLAGALLRGVFSVGRGNTNLANDVLPYANAIFGMAEDRTASPLDYLGVAARGIQAGQKGFNKGLLYSFMVPGQESEEWLQKTFGGQKPVEAGYEMFKGENFGEAADNLPFLNFARNEDVIGQIGVPFTDWKFDVTSAGLAGFGWDVGSDPASWATIGVGGLIKGTGRGVIAGVESASKKAAAKATGKSQEITARNMPRPFYAYSTETGKAGKAARKAEISLPANVKYNVLNTSIPMYILKESARGFKESHLRALAISTSRSAAKAARRGILREVSSEIAQRTVTDGVAPTTEKILGEILPAIESRALEMARKKIAGDVSNESNVESLLARVAGQTKQAAKAFAEQDLSLLTETLIKNAARISERAAADNISYVKAAEIEVMDAFARRVEAPEVALPRTKPARYSTKDLEGLSVAFAKAADGSYSDAQLGDAWEAFTANSDEDTVRAALEALISPMGYRTTARKEGVRQSARTKAASGVKEEVQAAGKKARTTVKLTSTEEMKEMKKRLRLSRETREGAKSEATVKAGKATRAIPDSEILEAPDKFLEGIAKALFPGKKVVITDKFIEELLANPKNITGKMLADNMPLRDLGSHRLRYLSERDAATPTYGYRLVDHLERNSYNPITAEAGKTNLGMFATSRRQAIEGKGDIRRTTQLAEVINLARQAGQQSIPPELSSVLQKLGVKSAVLESADSANAVEEILHAAYTKKYIAKHDKALAELATQKYGKVRAAELIQETVAEGKDALAGLREQADITAAKGMRLTDEEIEKGITQAGALKASQIEALNKLEKLGVNPHSPAGSGVIRVLSGRADDGAPIGRVAGSAQPTSLRQITNVKKLLQSPVFEGKKKLADILVPISKALQAIPNQTPEVKALVEEVREVMRAEVKRLSGSGTQQNVREIFAKIGNRVALATERVDRGSVAGFDFAFTRRNNEYDKQGVLSFIARGYAASRQGADDGAFADLIDDMLKTANQPPMKSIKNHKDRAKLADSIYAQYSGQGITPALLMGTMRVAESKGKQGAFATDKLFLEDLTRMENQFFKEMEDTLGPIYAPDTGALGAKTGYAGWIDKLTDTEQKVARGVLADHSVTLQGDELKSFSARLLQEARTNKAPFNTVQGKKGMEELQKGEMSFGFYSYLDNAITQGKLGDVGLRKFYDKVVGGGNQSAAKAVGKARATALIQDIKPAMIGREELITAANKTGDRFKAYDAVRSRLILARIMMHADADASVRFALSDYNVLNRLMGQRTLDGLKKEKEQFTKLLDNLDSKFSKVAGKPDLDVTERPLMDLINNGSARDVIAKIRTMDPTQNTADWTLAMKHLKSMQGVGKEGAYKSYSQLIDSYKSGVNLQPGDYNPATGKPVPDPLDVIEAIRLAGGETEKYAEKLANKKNITQKNVIDLIDKAEGVITRRSIERAQKHDFIEESSIAGGDLVRQASNVLPDDFQEKVLETVLTTRLQWQRSGNGWRELLAMKSLGASYEQFFQNRFQNLTYALKSKLGRLIDSDKPAFGDSKGDYLKRSWEPLTSYTGDKQMLRALSDMAETKFPNWRADEALRAKRASWLRKEYVEISRFREGVLMSNGIMPQNTISLKSGEAKLASVAKLLDSKNDDVRDFSVYLSHLDVMDIIPTDIVERMFFYGRELAFPQTAIVPAARLLVGAIDNLGDDMTWFTTEQVQMLASAMSELTTNAAIRTSTSEFGNVSLAKVDPDAFADIVTDLTMRMLQPENAMKLYDQHVINATVAVKVYKYESDQISEAALSAWRKTMESQITTSGDKMQATIDATDSIRKFLGDETLGSPAGREMAALNMQALLASEIGIDDFITLNEARKIANAGSTKAERTALGGEISKIKALQSTLGTKERTDLVAQAMHDTTAARMPLFDTIYLDQVAARAAKGGRIEYEDQFDPFNEVATNLAYYNWSMKFATVIDKWAARMFSDYKMESLRRFYGGHERNSLEDTEEYTQILLKPIRRWQQVQASTGRNYPSEAFRILQEVPDGELNDLMIHSDIMVELARKRGPKPTDAQLAAIKEQFDFAPKLRQYFQEDETLLEAAVEVWAAVGHLIGGGLNSKVVRSGLAPKWLNQQIKTQGGKAAREAIGENGEVLRVRDGYGFGPGVTEPQAMAQAWKEWDIENPFQMAIGLNSALAKGSKIPHAADEVVMTYGRKLSDYKIEGESPKETLARAKQDGLVKIKNQQTLSPGREMVYFMDTEGYLFDESIALEIGTFSNFLGESSLNAGKIIDGLAAAGSNSKWEAVQNIAKASMTILRPGNWSMNSMGMVWASFMGGMTNPVGYLRTADLAMELGIDVSRIGIDKKTLKGELSTYFANRQKDGFVIKEANNPLKGEAVSVLSVKGKGFRVAKKDMAELYKQIGGRVPTAQSRGYDSLGELGSIMSAERALNRGNIRRMYSKVIYKIGRGAAIRDDYFRLALWEDIMLKNNWTDLVSGGKEALRIVDRYHPQMQDLSKFNQEVTRKLVLFFTWRAKSLGWIVNDLLDKPGPIMTTVKAQYNFQQMQGQEPEYLGTSDIKNMPKRSYQQNAMEYVTPDGAFGFSLANPAMDLLGSNQWLSGINFNNYDSPGTLAMTNSLQTLENFLYSATPLIGNAILNWSQQRLSTGADLSKNGISATGDFPLYVEDLLSNLGWSAPHILLMQIYPEVFYKASWEGDPNALIVQKQVRSLLSYALGIRPTIYDSVENRKTALQEILSKVAELGEEKRRD